MASLAPLYAQRALIPASPWLDATAPAAPAVTVVGKTLTLMPGTGEAARWFYVRARVNGAWVTRVLFGTQRSLTLDGEPTRVLVNAADQAGNLSGPADWRR